MLNRRTDLKVHVHKFHEHDNDDEDGKMMKPSSRSVKRKKDFSLT